MATGTIHQKITAPGKRKGRLDIRLNGSTHIPAWVVDHATYRRWARSDEFPESGRYSYLEGTIWIDLTMEQIFSHNAVKTEIAGVLARLVRREDLGYLFSDGTLLSHDGAGLSTEPDACFVSYETVASGKTRWIEGATEGYVEVEGSPDLVVEVISASSVAKDSVVLRKLYWLAGVAEYWLVDASGPRLDFSLLKHSAKGYTEARRQAEGWVKSSVLGKQFRLLQAKDRLGNPRFTLEVQ